MGIFSNYEIKKIIKNKYDKNCDFLIVHFKIDKENPFFNNFNSYYDPLLIKAIQITTNYFCTYTGSFGEIVNAFCDYKEIIFLSLINNKKDIVFKDIEQNFLKEVTQKFIETLNRLIRYNINWWFNTEITRPIFEYTNKYLKQEDKVSLFNMSFLEAISTNDVWEKIRPIIDNFYTKEILNFMKKNKLQEESLEKDIFTKLENKVYFLYESGVKDWWMITPYESISYSLSLPSNYQIRLTEENKKEIQTPIWYYK